MTFIWDKTYVKFHRCGLCSSLLKYNMGTIFNTSVTVMFSFRNLRKKLNDSFWAQNKKKQKKKKES